MAKNENSNFSYMTRRIGGTTYKVKVVFSDTEKETMEDKILRMIRNETVTTGGTCGIIDSPQMTPSAAEAQGYERVNKYPKSTKFGKQNPITERWNSEEQLVQWRKAWAEVTNRYLQQYGHDARIDHRGHAERGLDEQPTIHEGAVARALEKKGIISDRCEINRQIKVDNALLRELTITVKKLDRKSVV